MEVRRLDPFLDAEACDEVVASLPEWFGMEEGIREAAEAARTHEGFVAVDDAEPTGWATFVLPYPTTGEVSPSPCTATTVGWGSARPCSAR